ncbi:MAG: hypothetical protein MZU97_22925 [Bacillus subtilis]|nr:hypothetical protein [Bacillus subtilis]
MNHLHIREFKAEQPKALVRWNKKTPRDSNAAFYNWINYVLSMVGKPMSRATPEAMAAALTAAATR